MDPEINSKYQKYKMRVKKWEKEFKNVHKRIPSKYDIRDANLEIRQAYKMYYRLKSGFLENTLSDIFDKDGFDLSSDNIDDVESSNIFVPVINFSGAIQSPIAPFSNVDDIKNDGISLTNRKNIDDDDCIKDFQAEQQEPVNDKGWGEGSDRRNVSTLRHTRSTISLNISDKVGGNLFRNSSFSTRNPRKCRPLSQTASLSSFSQSCIDVSEAGERLPDLESLLSQKSQTLNDSIKNVNLANTRIIPTVDNEWLDRCSSITDKSITSIDKPDISSVHFGLTNINSTALLNRTNSINLTASKHPSLNRTIQEIHQYDEIVDDEIIENSEDESSQSSRPILHVSKRRIVIVSPKKNPKSERTKLLNSKLQIEKSSNEILPTDPETTIHQETETGRVINKENYNKNTAESDRSVDDSEVKVSKKKLNRKAKTKQTKREKKLGETTKTRTKIKLAKAKKNDNDEDDTEQSGPQHFEIDSIDNVPAFSIHDLKHTNKLISKFINEASDNIENGKLHIESMENVKKSKLEQKIATGQLNENFVRIDIQKKVFVKGKKAFNYSRHKKTLWKKKKIAAMAGPDMDMNGCDGGFLTCFKCGKLGHFAQNCKAQSESDNLLPLDDDIEDSLFPTLDEVKEMLRQKDANIDKDNTEKSVDSRELDNLPEKKTYVGHKIPDDFLKASGLLDDNVGDVEALYNLSPDNKVIDTTEEVYEALQMFGHESFRKGQDKAIMRILSGQSTLVTLSTGSGKSLCYQLPAYLYSRNRKCITLVISPLVSLMEDQVHGVPHFLNAQCLHTNQTEIVRNKTMDMIKTGKVDVILISPEAVVAGEKSTGFGSLLRQLPPIAFACIDEAHCVSQWSHNFRPSYLMICRVLKEKFNVKTILGLTATATYQTRESIIHHIGIRDGIDGVISDIPLPDNLLLSVSKDPNRDGALIRLLRDDKFMNYRSIIIYCTKRDECERVATLIRTNFQDLLPDNTRKIGKRKREKTLVEAYHAGLPAYKRRTIQKGFMSGLLRIVVATVAFGMGINKSNIRAIIHYNMPANYECYVQEVGRSGRDGLQSHCHLFLNNQNTDLVELKRHIYANSVDRYVIRKLLEMVFVPCECRKNNTEERRYVNDRICPGHEVAFSVEETVQILDIPEENIMTLLCYLELHESRYIKVMSKVYTMCKIISYAGVKAIKQAAKDCPPLAMAIALDLKKGITHGKSTTIEFPVIKIASAIGWDSGMVKYKLKDLEWTKVNGRPKRSSITVQFHNLGFRIRSPGDLSETELDDALEFLQDRAAMQEKTQLFQVQNAYNGISSVAMPTFDFCMGEDISVDNSNKLKSLVREYFQEPYNFNNMILNEDDMEKSNNDEQILSDIRSMIYLYPENSFTGRAIARIFHGIQSPVYPAVIWFRCKYWRAHTNINFRKIVQLANAEIVRMRT